MWLLYSSELYQPAGCYYWLFLPTMGLCFPKLHKSQQVQEPQSVDVELDIKYSESNIYSYVRFGLLWIFMFLSKCPTK